MRSELTNGSSNNPEAPIRVFTHEEAAKLLRLSQSKLDLLIKAGKIGVCRAGSKKLYLPRHIEEYLATIERKAKAA